MPLTLVLGPANSAKAGEVLGAFGDAAHRGALLVVPTTFDAEHYARELARDGIVLGSVLTFRGLAREVARRAGYAGRRLSELQREVVLRRAVDGLTLDALGRSARAPGFAGAAGELIAELQRSLITPQRLHQALSAWAAADTRRAAYARDVASIYRAYVGELDRIGRVDAELFAWRALDALRAEPGRWGDEAVFLYGFDDLTAIERDAVETLSRIVGVEVTVSLTYEPGRAALSARAEVVQELRAIAQRVRELPPLDEHYGPASRAALHHLERCLFEPDPDRIDPGDSVRLLEAAGDRAEAELVAAEVIELLRAGVAAEEIVVVSRSLARTAAVIERVFARYRIPLASRRRVPFAHTALGRSVRALARCALVGDGGARAGDLLDYLRTPGLLERPEIADALEAEVRREGILSARHARERLAFELDEIDVLRSADDLPAELARQARRMLSLPHRGSAAQLTAAEEQDAHALAALLAAVAQLGELGERVSATQLLTLLDDLELLTAPAPRPGAVLLAEPLAVRARRFRAVFVCGLVEGEFPLPGSSEPFLSDEQRHELAVTAGLRLAPSESALDRERYLFYACVSRATERIVFSYRSSDEEGNLELPSPFVADVADLFVPEWLDRRRRRLLADVVWSRGEAPTERELALAQAREAPARSDAAWLASGDAGGGVRVLGDRALAHVRHREVVSGGALETFAACPVKWLVERELSPARFEPNPDPLARGSYIHRALEDVIGRLDAPLTPESLPDALRILDEVLADLPPAIAAGRPQPVREAMLRSIAADLRRYLEHEAAGGAGWQPQALELRFGFTEEEGSLPMLALGGDGERTFVRGVIDRVDVDPEDGRRAIVRDYKSGSARPEQQGARWQADRQLQVALYMLAVRELLGLEPVGGLYQPLGGGDLRPRGVFLRRHADRHWRGRDRRARASAARRAAGRRARPGGGAGGKAARRGAGAMPADLLAQRLPVPRHLLGGGVAVQFTPEQTAAIERRSGDLLLDASAGSGKTSVLVERFVRAVLEDGVAVGAILTITFTEKAAAELRDRIRGRLRALGADEAARATEGAFISTIHGFCARVLRTHALTAGIDPAFVVLDETQAQGLADEAFDDALAHLARDQRGAIDLIAAYGVGLLRDAIVAVFSELRARGEAHPRLPPLPDPETDGEQLEAELREAAERAAAELGAIPNPAVRVVQALDRLDRCATVVAAADPWPGELESIALPGGNGAALTTDVCRQYTEALANFRRACEWRRARRVHALLDRLLIAFGERYEARKRDCSGVDFEDLELLCRDLLSGDERTARALSPAV